MNLLKQSIAMVMVASILNPLTGCSSGSDPEEPSNDLPRVKIKESTLVVEPKSGEAIFDVEVQISEAPETAIKLKWLTGNGVGEHPATKGTDYYEHSGDITFNAGEASFKVISIFVKGDDLDEADEQFEVKLIATDQIQYDGDGIVTIQDSEDDDYVIEFEEPETTVTDDLNVFTLGVPSLNTNGQTERNPTINLSMTNLMTGGRYTLTTSPNSDPDLDELWGAILPESLDSNPQDFEFQWEITSVDNAILGETTRHSQHLSLYEDDDIPPITVGTGNNAIATGSAF